jgi:hypothetical protein
LHSAAEPRRTRTVAVVRRMLAGMDWPILRGYAPFVHGTITVGR